MMGRKKQRKPSRSEALAEALIGVHSTGAKDKAAMHQLVIATISAFSQGVGISWRDYEEMMDALYGPLIIYGSNPDGPIVYTLDDREISSDEAWEMINNNKATFNDEGVIDWRELSNGIGE